LCVHVRSLIDFVASLVVVVLTAVASFVDKFLILKIDRRNLLLDPSFDRRGFQRRETRRVFYYLIQVNDALVIQDHRDFPRHWTLLVLAATSIDNAYISKDRLSCSFNNIISEFQLLSDSQLLIFFDSQLKLLLLDSVQRVHVLNL
jgi:hypothetical protein